MSINQITSSNTFGQLITAVAAMIAVANNLTDGPQVSSNAAWTFTNAGAGINVSNTSLMNTANVQFLNAGFANIVSGNITSINTSTANVTTANIVGATITNIISTDHLSANANISGLLQVSGRMNVFSANIESANLGALALTTLSVTQLTVPVLNASFANVTTLSVTGTSQHLALIAVLVTTDNCNVVRLNATTANITGMTFGTMNTGFSNTISANSESMNVGFANIVSGNIASINTSTANITTAFITSANILSENVAFANIVNTFISTMNASIANITTIISANMAANPTVNLGIATKNYVDTGAGGNLVSKLSFNAKGDLPVGNAAQNFAILASGSNGQSLVIDTQTSTGLRWGGRASQTFRNLTMGTSLADKIANGTQLVVYKLDEVVMDDGEVVTSWTTPATIDLAVTGAGGLDGGTANANTWYEVYAIRKRVDGTKNFIIHRALDRSPDQNTFSSFYPYSATVAYGLNATANTTNYTRFAQSFMPNVAGPLTSIEIRGYKLGQVAGNLWLTVEGNTAGIPNSTTLATSRKLDAARLQLTNTQNLKFIFDTTATVNVATSYFFVVNYDNAAAAGFAVNIAYSDANTDIGANNINRGLPYGFSGTWQQLTSVGTFIYKAFIEANNNAITMPAGYDQKCLISYAATDVNTKLKEFHQRDRTIMPYFTFQWASFPTLAPAATGADIMDLQLVVPPIHCTVSFLLLGSAVAQSCVVGRVHVLDLPAPSSITEGTTGASGMTWCTSGGGSIAIPPSPPIWVEQQSILARVQFLTTKFYPCSITF